MTQNEIISSGLLELYVLGLTNEQETAMVVSFKNDHIEVADEITAIESGLEHFAQVHAIAPAIKWKEKIYDKLSNENKNIDKQQTTTILPNKAISGSFWKYAAAASIILFVGSAMLNYYHFTKYERTNEELIVISKEKSTLEQQLAEAQISNEDMKNDLSVVQSKYSEPMALHGMPMAPDAAAKIFWMKNTGDVFIDPSNLPDAPEGMQYQFWAIVDGKPIDGGLIFTTKKGKYHIQKMKSFGKAEAFAVTLESMGGNPQPKGDMVVMGKM